MSSMQKWIFIVFFLNKWYLCLCILWCDVDIGDVTMATSVRLSAALWKKLSSVQLLPRTGSRDKQNSLSCHSSCHHLIQIISDSWWQYWRSCLTNLGMGICVTKQGSSLSLTADPHIRRQHPQGVAGLKIEEIDHEPEHHNPKGAVPTLPFIEMGVTKTTFFEWILKLLFRIMLMIFLLMESQLYLQGNHYHRKRIKEWKKELKFIRDYIIFSGS